MSLLNEMLKDIEKKKATDVKEKLNIPSLNTASWTRQFQSYLRIIVLSVIFANVMIGAAILITRHKAQTTPIDNRARLSETKPSLQHVVRQSSLPSIGLLVDKKITPKQPEVVTASIVTVDSIKKESQPTLRELSHSKYQQALKAVQFGDIDAGTQMLKDIVKADSQYFDAWNSLIIALMDGSQQKAALNTVEKAIREFPTSIVLVQHKARLLMKLGRYKESITELLQRRPNIEESPNYYALLAALYEKTKESLKAGEIYQMLVQLYPENANYWLGFALALEHAEHTNQALGAYQKVLESYNPSPVVAAFARERILTLRG